MLTFYNPHVDDFLADPPHFRFLKRRALKKYGFIFEQMRKSDEPIRVLVDSTSSAFVPERVYHRLPYAIRKVIADLEFASWVRINGLHGQVTRVPVPTAPTDEVLFAFSYKAATGNFSLRKSTLSRYRSVVFHLSHYFVATGEKSRNIYQLENAWLAGDADIENNFYYKQFFSWYEKKFLVLPFSVASRFTVKKEWFRREELCVATGSFHDLTLEQPAEKYANFIEVTGHTSYHPIRREIYENRDQISDFIYCKTSPYRSNAKASLIASIVKRFDVSQKTYFAIDLVDLYNSYRYAVVGEEVSGFPALGAFEAMASGCTLIAVDGHYDGLGLIPGVHYLNYDGTLAGLTSTLAEARQSNAGEAIAESGRELVETKFDAVTTYSQWMSAISSIG